jgi:hypothetical protein
VGTEGTFTNFHLSKNWERAICSPLAPITATKVIHSFALSRVTSALAFHRPDIRSSSQPKGVAAISKAKT